MINDKKDTITFSTNDSMECREIIQKVYKALKMSGYDPVGQIVGYLASDEPTYITSANGARSTVTKVQRYALMKEIVEFYLKSLEEENK